ncbi:hypothetical protein [Sporosarcina sp. HYO08]|uniref:hypothetical protein n=1 Tax=Sporosarcina sp. HYO08 TaxID=1759557 RepID=UPI00079A45D2|nr:hypothetical protein [Sporosarcina sp. HYO08]KXH87449.1 hypothetical protein AU377_02435 [Sporosarcina sp. HYO08]
MNEKGYSWPEAILTLGILVVIFGSLLPFASAMAVKLTDKKFAIYAAETALQATILWRLHGTIEGSRIMEGVQYDWAIVERGICVEYLAREKVERKCLYGDAT